MATLTPATLSRSGQQISEAAVDAGGTDNITVGAGEQILFTVTNGNGSPCVVTVYGYVDGGKITLQQFTVPAGEQWIWGPSTGDYVQDDSTIEVAFSVVASVTIKTWKLP